MPIRPRRRRHGATFVDAYLQSFGRLPHGTDPRQYAVQSLTFFPPPPELQSLDALRALAREFRRELPAYALLFKLVREAKAREQNGSRTPARTKRKP